MIKNEVKKALQEFFESEDGRNLIVKAVRTAMVYDLELEKHHKDDTIERIKERGDILTYIAGWISKSEGAIRGCQQDVEKVNTHIWDLGFMIEGMSNKQIEYKNAKRSNNKDG